MFSLLNTFSQANYPLQLVCNPEHESLGLHGDRIFEFDNLSVIDDIPDNTTDAIFLYDHADKQTLKQPWLKTIRVRFDIFSSFRFNRPILFPYPVHPVHSNPDKQATVDELRDSPKKIRLFFSGDMKGYNKSHVNYPEPKLPRLEVINTILESLPNNLLHVKDSQSAATLFSGPYSQNCAIIDTSMTWIDDRYWLDYLAKSDFFLAPPGIIMPMCHNIIEAMSVGAIPVTNYPEWFHPKLEHLKNCIAFSDKADLVEKVKLVLDMDREQIRSLRQNVIRYYQEFLKPARFIETVEKNKDRHIDVLMITERYVAKNSQRLNRNSFIIKGAPGESKSFWRKFIHVFQS